MLESILVRADIPLVTLTGPGGIGKSRLALEIARRQDEDEPVWFVELGNISEPSQVLAAIARAIGVPGTSALSVEAILDHLRHARGLVVLDTFEHVMEAAPDIAELIKGGAEVRFLVTSREPLGIRGEHTLTIPPLSLPPAPRVDDVMAAPATSLFIARAKAARPDFVIQGAAAELIEGICRSLNGLPLAIELAAARVRHMSLGQLRDQLTNRLNVLIGGARDLPPRQQAMRNTVRWSYDLLSPDECYAFNDLCLFSGGWTADAALAVAGRDVIQHLSALVDKSLVLFDPHEDRYGVLDVIRDFGREQEPNPGVRERHLAYFLALAREAETWFGGSSKATWVERLRPERANIRAALNHSLASHQADVALELAGALWRFWMLDGSLSEGRAALDAALHADRGSSPHRAKALWGSAWLAYHQGDYAHAARCGKEMVRLADPVDSVALRNAWTINGIVALAEENFGAAIEIFERCVAVLDERDWLFATSLLNLGMALTHAVDSRALQVLGEARSIYDELGDRHFAARTDIYSGYAAVLRGKQSAARASFRSALESSADLDDPWAVSESLEGLAVLSALQRRVEVAAVLGGAAEVLREPDHRLPFPADRLLIERTLERAQAAAGVETWHLAWGQGRSMDSSAAIRFALESISN